MVADTPGTGRKREACVYCLNSLNSVKTMTEFPVSDMLQVHLLKVAILSGCSDRTPINS